MVKVPAPEDNPLPLKTALGILSYQPVEGVSWAKPPFNP
jgi:hypothetical protein